jgi:hypothetical protein
LSHILGQVGIAGVLPFCHLGPSDPPVRDD